MSTVAILLLRGVLVFGGGSTVAHIAEADMSGDPALQAELHFAEPALGYEYEYFSMFFLDVWTGDGHVVLYDRSSDRFVPLTEDTMQALTGRSLDSIDPPFLYRVPLGWIVYGLFGLGILGGWVARFRQVNADD